MKTTRASQPTSDPPTSPTTDHFSAHLRRGMEAREAAARNKLNEQKPGSENGIRKERCQDCTGSLPSKARFCSSCGSEQTKPTHRTGHHRSSLSVGDGEAVIQVSNITGPVTISHVEGSAGTETTEKSNPENPISSAPSKPGRPKPNAPPEVSTTEKLLNTSSEQEPSSRQLIASTAAVVTSGAAIATGVGVLATSLRQILRPLFTLNGIGSLPLTPRSMAAALAAIACTVVVGSSIGAVASIRASATASKNTEAQPAPPVSDQLELFS